MSETMLPAANRLAVGIALSAAVHLFAMLNMNVRVANHFAWPHPLQVEIRDAVRPAAGGEIAGPSSGHIGTAPPPETRPQERPMAPAAVKDAEAEPGLPLDKYFTAREVDVRASQTNEVILIYPQRAYEMRLGGKMVLRIFINEQGGIDRVSVLAATPPGVFEEAALTATHELQFSPALKNGRQVKSQKTIEVIFDPYENFKTPRPGPSGDRSGHVYGQVPG